MAKLADIWYKGNGANYGRTQHYNDSRYHMLNLHALAAEGCTMEDLCMVGRIEPEWGYSKPKDVMGIRFKVN